MSRVSCTIYAVATLFGSSYLFAQSPRTNERVRLPIDEGTDVVFEPLLFDNGSSHSSVTQIVRGQSGFLWFGTLDGLKRYDGYRLRAFRTEAGNPRSLSGLQVESLLSDRSGQLWVAADLGVDRYDPATETFTHYPPIPAVFEGPVRNVSQDRTGTVWLSTTHGLNRIDPATGQMTRYLNPLPEPLRCAFEQKDGTFWVADKESVSTFDRKLGRITEHIPLRDPATARAGISANPKVAFYEDHAGVLWVASQRDGLATVDRQHNELRYFELSDASEPAFEPGVSTLIEDEQGTLWVGTNGAGLFKLDRDRTRLVRYRHNSDDPYSLSADRVRCLFEDDEGSIWVGTDGGGVVRFPSQPSFHRYRGPPDGGHHGTMTDFVSSAYQDRSGNIWTGGEGIVNRIDGKTGQITSYALGGIRRRLAGAHVISIAEDGTGNLWFGALGGGLHRFDPFTGRWKTFRHTNDDPGSLSHDTPFDLHIDRLGRLWVGTEDGLNLYDPKTERFRAYRIREVGVNRDHSIAEDSSGALWLAALYTGVHRFDPTTGHFTVYRHSEAADSLSSDAVMSICVDHTGAVWAGTANGLNRLDVAIGKFTAYFERDGLAGNSISGIQEDRRGNLWVATNNGLSRFDRGTGTFQNYYRSDGVPADVTSIWSGRAGEMFLGSYTGLIRFSPERVQRTVYVPPIVLTDFQLADVPAQIGGDSPLKQSISLTKSLTLSHQYQVFSFEFAALSYASPAQTRYRYRLDPLEATWDESDSTHRLARYTFLDTGTYTFRVQSRTNGGTWTEKNAGIRIQVLPPWWNAWWFRLSYAFALGLTMWLGWRLRLHQIAQKFNMQLEARVSERTRIARELHDTLLQSFHGLMFRFQAARNMLPLRTEEAIHVLDGALERTEQAIAEGRDAVNDLRASTVVADELAQSVRALGDEMSHELAARHSAHGSAELHVAVKGTLRGLHPTLQDEIYAIAREAVRNAFRHAEAGSIEVDIMYGASSFHLQIRDDGKGIDPRVVAEGSAGHYGLQGMRERAGRLGGTLDLWSRTGGGTEIDLNIPGTIAYETSPAHTIRGLFRKKGEIRD